MQRGYLEGVIRINMTIEKALHVAALKIVQKENLPSFSDYVGRLINADRSRKRSKAVTVPRRFKAIKS